VNPQQSQPILMLQLQNPKLQDVIYPGILTQLRKIMVQRMAKPEEVIA